MTSEYEIVHRSFDSSQNRVKTHQVMNSAVRNGKNRVTVKNEKKK